MSRSRSRRVVLLLDCCYAGAFERGMTARAGEGMGIEAQLGGRGRAVITASSAMEYAFEGGELADARDLAPSVFTSALVEGLETGDADRDQDGLVALDELYDYIYDKVRTVTPNQTPGKWTFGVQGELVIARRARPVTTPAPLPPELQEAIDSPFVGVRGAAVQELVRLLHGKHAGQALAAQLALERLTEDDSRTVAATATEALRAQAQPAAHTQPAAQTQPAAPPRLELSATVIDFGPLAHDTTSPERRIRLSNAGGGTLNARAVSPASWLKLRQEGDELVLAVDTTVAGEHEHTVTVDSDGGSATIRVRARVEPAPAPGPQVPASPHPRAVAGAPEHDRPGPQPEASLTSSSPDTAPPVTATAPVAATPASGAVSRPAAGPAPPPISDDLRTVPGASHDRRLLVAGGVAIAGSVLELVGLFPTYLEGVSLAGLSFAWPQTVIAAAVTLAAGICTLIPRTRRLIGPGLLLGTVPASIWALVSLAADGLGLNGLAGGFWIQVAANLILVLSACLATLALASAAEVSFTRRPAGGVLPWVVTVLGVAGALALVFLDHNLWAAGGSLRKYEAVPSIWATVMAALVPACAVAVLPRRFGVSILAGWIGGAFSIFVYETLLLNYSRDQGASISSAPNVVFGITLLALVVAAAFFARTAPAPRPEPAAQG
jgi:hypothetical protein